MPTPSLPCTPLTSECQSFSFVNNLVVLIGPSVFLDPLRAGAKFQPRVLGRLRGVRAYPRRAVREVHQSGGGGGVLDLLVAVAAVQGRLRHHRAALPPVKGDDIGSRHRQR